MKKTLHMKKACFTLLCLGYFFTSFAHVDTSGVDTTCFVQIYVDAWSGSAMLTAQPFDISEPDAEFTFNWSSGETTQSIEIDAPGTYCVTATSNGSGCVVDACYTVDDDCEVFIFPAHAIGTLFAQGTGIEPISYLWDTGDTTQAIPGVDGVTYCVTATDAFGCEVDTCLLFEAPDWDTLCYSYIWPMTDSVTGDIVLTVEHTQDGITFPSNISYLWSTGEITQSITVDNPDTEYCVTTTDGSGCEAVSCYDFQNLFCEAFIDYDYATTFTAHGIGFPPFSYQWSTGEDSQSISVNPGEEYCVTVTDALNCSVETCLLADTTWWPNDTFCFAEIGFSFNGTDFDLTANLHPHGGANVGQEYVWSTGETTQSIVGELGNTYCVTITDTVFNCSAEACITLDDQDCEILHILCDPDGTLGIIFNGIYPYSYEWSTGDTTEFITGLLDSTYCVTVTDALGCSADTCFVFQGMPLDSFCFSWLTYDIDSNTNEIILTATHTSGVFPTGDVSYAWSTGDTTESITIANPTGEYCVTTTDAQGCEASSCFNFDGCAIDHILCDPDGTLGVGFSGIYPLSYVWSTGETTETIIGELDSTYCVTVTDAFGCSADTCFTFTGMPPSDSLNVILGFFEFSDTTLEIADGYTYLYQTVDSGLTFELVDSIFVQTNGIFGGYAFHVDPGTYITKAVLTDLATGQPYIPVYHYDALQWQDADYISVPGGPIMQPVLANILLSGTTSLTGNGSASGVVIDASRSDDGIMHVTMILTDAEGNPLQFVMTDENGEFNFDNLPYGSYRLYADHIGIRSEYVTFEISANNENQTFDFEVQGGELFLSSKEQILLQQEISIFPNPVSNGELNIRVSDEIQINSVVLMETSGKTAAIGSIVNSNDFIVPTRNLSRGIYVLQIVTDIGIRNQKVMIID